MYLRQIFYERFASPMRRGCCDLLMDLGTPTLEWNKP